MGDLLGSCGALVSGIALLAGGPTWIDRVTLQPEERP